jgi:hypothetical protein
MGTYFMDNTVYSTVIREHQRRERYDTDYAMKLEGYRMSHRFYIHNSKYSLLEEF